MTTETKPETKYPHLRYYTRPDSHMGPDWFGWYAFLGQSRDSDDLEESNFAVGLKAVQEVMSKESVQDEDGEDCASVQIVRCSHWLVGWVETIYIHESDTAALEKAEGLKAALEDYPALDESDWSNREWESFLQSWDSYGASDFRDAVKKTFTLTEDQEALLDNLDDDDLRQFFSEHANVDYEPDSSGVNINIDWVRHSMDDDELAELLDPEFKTKRAYEAAHPTLEL